MGKGEETEEKRERDGEEEEEEGLAKKKETDWERLNQEGPRLLPVPEPSALSPYGDLRFE